MTLDQKHIQEHQQYDFTEYTVTALQIASELFKVISSKTVYSKKNIHYGIVQL